MEINWPRGYAEFYHDVQVHKTKILTGLVIALDPSSGGSSQPGFAIYRAGELITSGELAIPKKSIYERLQLLHEQVSKLTPDVPDVFAIEEIRGQRFSHDYLKYAVGVSMAAARTTTILEVPINCWRALAKADPHYIKGNAVDSELIGETVIRLARGE